MSNLISRLNMIFILFSLVLGNNIFAQREIADVQNIIRSDERTNLPIAIYNVSSRQYSGTPEEIARQYLLENKTLFRFKDNLDDIKAGEVKESPGAQHVGFTQYYHGIPVFRSETVVSINKQNRISMVVSGYKPNISVITIPNIGKEYALSLSKQAIGVVDSKERFLPKTELVIYEDSVRVFHLAWKFLLFSIDQGSEWLILVDALNGEILEKFNVMFDYVNGKGRVFDPDPVSALMDASLTDQNDADYAELQDAYIDNAQLNELNNAVGGVYYVRGRYVWSMDANFPNDPISTEAHPDSFRYKRNQNGFEEVNVYFHIDKQRRYVGALGFTPTWDYLGANSQTIAFDARGTTARDAGFYPVQEYLIFGVPDSYVDAGEDQTVIIHEYGHALHDALMYGGIDNAPPASDTRGISEGIGDYLGISYRRTTQANPFRPNYRSNWFWPEEGESILSQANAYYPTYWVGQSPYIKMNVWASTLMDIEYNNGTDPSSGVNLGRDVITKLVLASLSYVTANSDVIDNVNAIFQADRDIYGGAHLVSLANVFYQRGFFYNNIVSGTISSNTTWSGIKYTTSDVTVNGGVTLTVEPNTFMFFANGSSLIINGSLEAIGTPPEIGSSGTITFDFVEKNNNGIKVNSGGTANISYADISNATNGIYFNQGSGTISHCNITDCNNGIYISSASPTIQSCTISNNQYGIYVTNSYSPNFRTEPIKNNTIQNNSGYGIYLYNSSPTLSGNVVSSCNNGAALFTNCNPMVYNNDITSNSNYGFACYGSSSPAVYYSSYFEIGGYNQFLSNGSDEVRITGSSNPNFGNYFFDGNNSFNDNSGYLMYNSTGSTISAENNWWGSSSGPGVNQIYGSVDYDPYLDEDPNNPGRAVFIDNPSLAVSSVNSTEDLSSAFNAYYGGNFTLAASLFKEYLNQNPKSESAL